MKIVPASSPSQPVPPLTPAIRALIIDDEPVARRGVRLLLERERDILVLGEAGTGREAEQMILASKPELIFLDVQMPGGDGFELLRRLPVAAVPAVVFVTAYDEHALRAFEVNAVDYLLKPYEDARFAAAVARAKEAVRRRQTDHVNAQLTQLLEYLQRSSQRAAVEKTFEDRILIKSAGEILFLKVEEIDWIEADGDYMKFHTGGRAHLMRETMARLEARLDPKRFVRIHRSTIVNIDRLRKLSPVFAGEYVVVLTDGTKLKLSRGYHERVAELFARSANGFGF